MLCWHVFANQPCIVVHPFTSKDKAADKSKFELQDYPAHKEAPQQP
jgi:hypothetical protein